MYIETSVPRTVGDSAILISPDFDISSLSSAEISFRSHMYGASMGTLRVAVSSLMEELLLTRFGLNLVIKEING